MKYRYSLLCFCLSLLLAAPNHAAEGQNTNPKVTLHTSKGAITLELYADKAPKTVDNFLEYAHSGFYDGTIFHRVIKRFMIQAGGFTRELERKPTRDPVVNESDNGLFNDRYTVAMARTADPDSATSQFFINTSINSRLNGRGDRPGYTVFGIVTDGRAVVKAIEKVETQQVGRHGNVPVEPVLIERVEVHADSQESP